MLAIMLLRHSGSKIKCKRTQAPLLVLPQDNNSRRKHQLHRELRAAQGELSVLGTLRKVLEFGML